MTLLLSPSPVAEALAASLLCWALFNTKGWEELGDTSTSTCGGGGGGGVVVGEFDAAICGSFLRSLLGLISDEV